MGNQLCSGEGLTEEIELKESQIKIKCHSSKVNQLKKSQSLVNGFVQIFHLDSNSNIIYSGEMRNSCFHGYGKLYAQNTLIYEGQFKEGLFDGWGTTPNYTGQFREGKFDGFGVFVQFHCKNPSLIQHYYEGYFFDGEYSGFGILIKNAQIPLPKIQEIQQKKGVLEYLYGCIEHGMQITKDYGAEQFYIGQFLKGHKHGMGRLFRDEKQFSGNFSGGNFTGKGTQIQSSQENQKIQQETSKKSKKLNKSCFRDTGYAQKK